MTKRYINIQNTFLLCCKLLVIVNFTCFSAFYGISKFNRSPKVHFSRILWISVDHFKAASKQNIENYLKFIRQKLMNNNLHDAFQNTCFFLSHFLCKVQKICQRLGFWVTRFYIGMRNLNILRPIIKISHLKKKSWSSP